MLGLLGASGSVLVVVLLLVGVPLPGPARTSQPPVPSGGFAVTEPIALTLVPPQAPQPSANASSYPWVIATIPVSGGPWQVVYDDINGNVYVSSPGSTRVTAIRGTSVMATIAVGGSPHGAAVDPRNGYVYVTDYSSNATSVLDGYNVAKTVAVGDSPVAATFDGANGFMYVTNSASDNLSVLNGSAVRGSVRVGHGPTGAVFDARDGYLYVPNEGSNNTSVVHDLSVVATIVGGYLPESATYDPANGFVYITNLGSNNVTVVNGTKIAASVRVGLSPNSAVYDPANGWIYVTNLGSNNVSVINGTRLVATVSVGLSPSSAAFDSADRYVYVADFGSTGVSVINGTTLVGTLRVGSGPVEAAFDRADGYVYVTSSAAGSVSVIGPAYTVALTESGLPAGASWTVRLAGVAEVSAAPTITFGEPNGTYSYSIAPPAGYTTQRSGNVTVAGRGQLILVPFVRLTYPVLFVESGLPAGSGGAGGSPPATAVQWVVTVNGSSNRSSAGRIGFSEANGTYNYSIRPIPGFETRWNGAVTVNGSAVQVNVSFTVAAYPVPFTESGLPAGTGWNVTIRQLTGGWCGVSCPPTTWSGSTGTLTLRLPNGSFAFTAAAAGYAAVGGSVSVRGPHPDPVNVTFVSPSSGTLAWAVALSGLGAIGIVATTVGLWWHRRRRRRGPEDASPPVSEPERPP